MDYLLANSGCSSGCDESGWTLYLDNSYVSPYASYNGNGNGNGGVVAGKCGFSVEKRMKDADDEEEDLSMVSDASSGPPHFAEEEDYVNDSNSCYYNAPVDAAALSKNTGKIKKAKETRHRKVHEQPSSLLDDTASSPVFDFSNNNFAIANNHESAENVLEFSQGYSTTHFEGRSGYQHQYSFIHSGNYLQKNHWFQGRR